MLKKLKLFRDDQRGAVTVDWVVLTAAIMGLNVFIIMDVIEAGLDDAGNDIAGGIDEARAGIGGSGDSVGGAGGDSGGDAGDG